MYATVRIIHDLRFDDLDMTTINVDDLYLADPSMGADKLLPFEPPVESGDTIVYDAGLHCCSCFVLPLYCTA